MDGAFLVVCWREICKTSVLEDSDTLLLVTVVCYLPSTEGLGSRPSHALCADVVQTAILIVDLGEAARPVAAVAAAPAAAAAACGRVAVGTVVDGVLRRALACRTGAEQDHGDEQGSESTPAETETVSAELSIAAGAVENVAGTDERGGHERNGNGEEDESDNGDKAANARAETTAAGEEAGEEGEDLEEKRQQVKDPAEAPHVVVVERRRVAAILANQLRWGVGCVGVPDLAKGHGRVRAAALLIVGAAGVQVRPLSNVVGASNACRVSLHKVGLVQWRRVSDAAEDDEEKEENGCGQHHCGTNAKGCVF